MEILLNEAQKQTLEEVCKALEELRDVAKGKVTKFKCHTIELNDVKEMAYICQSIQVILKSLNLTSVAFEEMRNTLYDLTFSSSLYDVSEFFNNDIMLLLDRSILELRTYIMPMQEKRTIKVKYVDFYGGFNVYEHWLYKILTKKYNVEFSDNPDYLFFSCFGNSFLSYDCIRIFISNEAVYPNLNLYDYSVTYADFVITDRMLPNRDAFEDLKYKKIAESEEEAYAILKQKKEFCNFVYSNQYGDNYRKELFDILSRYKLVLAGGKFLNNIGENVDDLESFQNKFKFSISCENSFYKGYTTEKIINALNAKTIPIYWGNPDVSSIINPKAIINCHDYSDIYSVVEEVIRLDNDDEAYIKKLQEPILIEEDMIEKYLKEREAFIYRIIDQPYVEAFRRNQGLRGQWYNDFMCFVCGYPNEWFSPEKNYFIKKKN